ncbi:MAG TPA: hypothetical protein PK758_12685, partial [Tenuifilaceae bacterium]|nr:hypothetical protein [Tenuifilaceae bacterium]
KTHNSKALLPHEPFRQLAVISTKLVLSCAIKADKRYVCFSIRGCLKGNTLQSYNSRSVGSKPLFARVFFGRVRS